MGLAFGDLLRQARRAASLSQQELADRSGLTVNGISQLERGVRTRPYPHTVRVLAEALALDGEERARLATSVPSRDGATAVRRPSRIAVPPLEVELVGRDDDLSALLSALHADRLVTLTGPGGVGKTALAVAAANAVGARFEERTFVSLADVEEVETALLTLAARIGLQDTGAADVSDQLRTALRGRARLLVLDNLEQLPALGSEVSDLLSVLPNLTVLATSRAPLRLRVERVLPVRPLTVPPRDSSLDAGPGGPEALADGIMANDAVRLLLARAGSSPPPLGAGDAAALAMICQRVDGLPLAIELVAAWLRVLTPRELADRLDDALPMLVGGARDLPDRHRTMRAAIAWSEALLEDDQRRLFRRLGVLPADWDLETAAAVVDLPEPVVLRGVALLVERNLVVRSDQDLDGRTRYRLLATVRAYACEQLDIHDDLDAARARLADAVLDLVTRASQGLDGAEQGDWLDRVEDRLPDVRTTLQWALEAGAADLAARCYAGLFWAWFLRHATEGASWGQQVLADGRVSDPVAGSRARATWALAAFASGDAAAAMRQSHEAAEVAAVAGDPAGRLRALAVRVNAAAASGDVEEVRRAADQIARATASAAGDGFPATARAVATLARVRVALAAGDHARADELLAVADAEVERAAAPWSRVLWLNIAVAADQVRGRHDRTLPRLRRSIELSSKLGDAPATLHALVALAVDLVLRQRPADAARVFAAAEAHGEHTGQRISDPATLQLVTGHRAEVEELLGAAAFERAVAEGAGMSVPQTLALAR